jgi:hypothetical protein
MLERLLYASLAVAALTSAPGCATIEKSTQEQRVQDSFYAEKKVLEEIAGEKSVLYTYRNGIEAEVTYKKNEGLSDIYINILVDPNNVLVQGIPVTETPDNCSYQEMVDADKVKKAITFSLDTGTTVSILITGQSLTYVKLRETKNGKERMKDWPVPELLKPFGEQHVKKIEEYLNLEAHRRVLDLMPPTSSKTQSF